MASTVRIEFNNGLLIHLTKGEANAIERLARMNGTDPLKVQFDPGFVQRRSLDNLRRKGVLCQQSERGGCFHFVPGLLPVMPGTLNSARPFVLLDHVTYA